MLCVENLDKTFNESTRDDDLECMMSKYEWSLDTDAYETTVKVLRFAKKTDFPAEDNTTKIFDWLTASCVADDNCEWTLTTDALYR